MNIKMKIGILGLGMIGKLYLKHILCSEKFQLSAICSKSFNSAKDPLVIPPEIRIFRDKDDFFKSNLFDVVIVCNEHKYHTQDAIKAIKCGKHVLIEKPIATSSLELLKLLKTAYKHRNSIVTALPCENDEHIKNIIDIINDGTLGKITCFHSFMDVPGPPRGNWYYKSIAVGGTSLDTLPYCMTRLINLVQKPIESSCGFKNKLISYRKCIDGLNIKCEVDDNSTIVLKFSSGQQAIVRSSWNVSNATDLLVVRGRKGDLYYDPWNCYIKVHYYSDSRNNKRIDILNLPKVNNEQMKLGYLYSNIQNKSSNLKIVAYSMDLIFSNLWNTSGISKPPFIKSSISKFLDLEDNIYI